ncbi:unnamed protein product [Rangifer tarandus platyrhynchus]|uniref:Uncharacterized protein n=2 Tax=Rangifer tarandus platyrhynchus TaxID=3082113 RepID=A0ABN8YVV5_RANTA|nr:unnamed protein product [Rangifer tarandus platyrhynchus]CAI9693651.1 unnamed protein product [Rangifer tarandus platyrhynchus]
MARPPNPNPASSSGPSHHPASAVSATTVASTGSTETCVAPLIGAASPDLPTLCQVGTALSPGRPGRCPVTSTAGSSFSVLRSSQVPSRAAVSRDVSTRVASVWPVRVLAGPSLSFAHVGPSTGGRQGLRSSCQVLLPAGREGVPRKVGRGPEPARRSSSPESLSPSHLAWMTLPGPHPTPAGRAAKGPTVTRVLPPALRPQPARGPLATGSSQPTAERLSVGGRWTAQPRGLPAKDPREDTGSVWAPGCGDLRRVVAVRAGALGVLVRAGGLRTTLAGPPVPVCVTGMDACSAGATPELDSHREGCALVVGPRWELRARQGRAAPTALWGGKGAEARPLSPAGSRSVAGPALQRPLPPDFPLRLDGMGWAGVLSRTAGHVAGGGEAGGLGERAWPQFERALFCPHGESRLDTAVPQHGPGHPGRRLPASPGRSLPRLQPCPSSLGLA